MTLLSRVINQSKNFTLKINKIPNTLLLRSTNCNSVRGTKFVRGARVSGAVAARVHSVTRSLRYIYTARPTLAISKEKVTMPENKPFQRLPNNVIPKHYALELIPNLEKFTFKGKTAVKVSVSRCRDYYCYCSQF